MDPSIRYCAYNLRLKGGQTMDVSELLAIKKSAKESDLLGPQLTKILLEAREKESHGILNWRSHSIDLKNVEWGLVLESMQEAILEFSLFKDDELSKNDIQIRLSEYDRLLGTLYEASELSQKDLKSHLKQVEMLKSSKSEEKTKNLECLFGYVSYHRLMCTVKRNLLLIISIKLKLQDVECPRKEKPKQEDAVKLYDSILSVFYYLLLVFLLI